MEMGRIAGLLRSGLGVLALAALIAQPAVAELPKYQVKDLGSLGGRHVLVLGMNESGQVVGGASTAASDAGDPYHLYHPFLYDGSTIRDLSTGMGGASGLAHGINNAGKVVGYFRSAETVRAFLYDGATFENICEPLCTWAFASDINDTDKIVGSFSIEDPASQGGFPVAHAFLYDGGTTLDLGTLGGSARYATSEALAISNSGYVVGSSTTDSLFQHPFSFDGTTMRDLGSLGGQESYAYATDINESEHVVGYYSFTVGTYYYHAFLWDGATMRDLGTLGGQESYAHAINDSGYVVGISNTPYRSTAFVWDGTQMQDLDSLVVRRPGWSLDNPGGGAINNRGQIAVSAYNPSIGRHPVLLTPIALLLDELLEEAIGVGPGKSLARGATNANAYYQADDLQATCATLLSFIDQVNKFAEKKKPKISQGEAGALIEDAEVIMDSVGCD